MYIYYGSLALPCVLLFYTIIRSLIVETFHVRYLRIGANTILWASSIE
jgi:hypothetical protein